MSSQQSELSQKVEEITGHAQIKKDECTNKASNAMDKTIQSSQSDQNSSITSQATNFLQQTGEQVKSMAQGAAEAVKNTLGMNIPDNTADSKNPNNTTSPSMPGFPSTRI